MKTHFFRQLNLKPKSLTHIYNQLKYEKQDHDITNQLTNS